jgi:hypothetical protein
MGQDGPVCTSTSLTSVAQVWSNSAAQYARRLFRRPCKMIHIQNNFFLSFLQVKNKPYHHGKYACILLRDAVANPT